jgi:hypothetical protein
MTAGVSGARLEPHEQAELMRIVLAGPDPADGLGVHAQGSGAHLRSQVRQELSSRLNGTAPKAVRPLPAESKAEPPAKRSNPSGAL